MLFAAVHESLIGTKRTSRDVRSLGDNSLVSLPARVKALPNFHPELPNLRLIATEIDWENLRIR